MIQAKCSACGMSFKLDDKFAGKTATCKCGQKFKVPSLVADPQPPAQRKCPACSNIVAPDAVLCFECGYDFRTERIIQNNSALPQEQSSLKKNLIFGGGGLLVVILLIVLFSGGETKEEKNQDGNEASGSSAAKAKPPVAEESGPYVTDALGGSFLLKMLINQSCGKLILNSKVQNQVQKNLLSGSL